ncbi:O-antigen ligase family protein [candidate division KSB1 bacterium]|nr:O-antigen ligase family protein [candidate division KSB1 bacterium]
MPPIVALVMCLGFVIFLLRIDYKQVPKMSLALWLPTIWILIAASKPLGVWFPFTSRVEDVTSSPLDQATLLILFSLGLLVIVRRKLKWLNIVRKNVWLIVFVYFLFLSIFWSDIPFISFKRWIREVIAVLMALVMLSEQNPQRAMQAILRRTAFILIPFSLLLIKYFPTRGVEYGRWSGDIMWIGVTMQKNGLGRLCMISAFFLIWTFIKRWQGLDRAVVKYQTYAELLVFALTLRLLVGPTLQAYSASAVMAFLAGLMAFFVLFWMKKSKVDMRAIPFELVIVIVIFFGVVSVFEGGLATSDITGALGRDGTLTGRTEVWANLLPVATQRIILGHGFGAFWTNTSRMNFEISDAHSGYLDVMLETGIMGLFLISVFIISSCRKAQSLLYTDFYWASLWIVFLLMLVVHNVAETSLNTLTSHMTASVMFMAVISSSMKSDSNMRL